MSQTTCFSCLKIGHINRYCLTRSKAQSCEFDKGKGKENIEHIRDEMNKTWKRKLIATHQMENGSLNPVG